MSVDLLEVTDLTCNTLLQPLKTCVLCIELLRDLLRRLRRPLPKALSVWSIIASNAET